MEEDTIAGTETAQTFPKFTSLPPELRLAIWAYCVPRRVVEMHDSKRRCRKRGTARTRTRRCAARAAPAVPPLISRVCCESRAVALRHGGVEDTAAWGPPAWLDRRDDVVNIDKCDGLGFFRVVRRLATPAAAAAAAATTAKRRGVIDPDPGLQALVQEDRDIAISISRELIEFDYFHPLGGAGSLAQWALYRIAERRECRVVLCHVSMHMSHEDACASGFFGIFAEETTVHVDVRDAKQLEALSTTYDKAVHTPPGGRGRRRMLWLRQYLSNGHADDDVLCFLQCVKTAWLVENEVVPRNANPYGLHPEQASEPRLRALLEQLPDFAFVIAVHLCKGDYEECRKRNKPTNGLATAVDHYYHY